MKKRYIDILRVTHLRGPNAWTYVPVLEALVDIGELEDFPSNTLPGFPARLSAWLPTLIEHRCSYEERGGFLRRVNEGTWPCHILEHVTLELQSLAGLPGGFGRARETSERGVYKVVVNACNQQVTQAALFAARDLVMAAIDDRPFDVPATVRELRKLADSLWLGPSTACIVQAAEDRGIPAIRLSDGNLVQLGYGAHQRRIWTAETELTSAIAEGISRDKDLTKQLLHAVGVPVPEGRLVDDADDAWVAAQEIGLPVVVKPYDGNHGRGVFTNLNTCDQVRNAWTVAAGEGNGVIVERFVSGNEHRLLVVDGKLVAAARGDVASVHGDGRSTILELIESQLNSDPRRGRTEDTPLNTVRIDSAAMIELANQGFEPHSITPAGTCVLIQRNGNVAFDVTDIVHPSVAQAASLAARTVGLDIAGVDLVVEDISRPLAEQRGAIVEVNAGPGLLMHLKPAEGTPRPVGRAIADHLFPEGAKSRIPVIGITGHQGTPAIARLLARLLALAGRRTGLACRDGLFLEGRRIEQCDSANWASGVRLLTNRRIEAAIIEGSARTIATEGLAYDRCALAIVTGVNAADAMPDRDICSLEQLYGVLRTQVDVVLPDGAAVLNASDPMVVKMAPLCDGEVIFFGRNATLPAIDGHRARGGRSVHTREGVIVLATGSEEAVLTALASVPLLGAGADLFAVETVLAGIAAAWALGVPVEVMRAAIETCEREQIGVRAAVAQTLA